MSHFHPTLPRQSLILSSHDTLFKQLLIVLFGVIVIALASQLSIPLEPVPLTFQSATVILIGMAYGPRYGAYVITAYLVAGALGLPVYANFHSGLTTFFTSGYLIGFLPATVLSGYLAQKSFARNIILSFVAACAGASILFLCGLAFLATTMSWQQAITVGLLPFIISEPIKLFAVACVAPRLWKKQ